jgi:hypothetical protein
LTENNSNTTIIKSSDNLVAGRTVAQTTDMTTTLSTINMVAGSPGARAVGMAIIASTVDMSSAGKAVAMASTLSSAYLGSSSQVAQAIAMTMSASTARLVSPSTVAQPIDMTPTLSTVAMVSGSATTVARTIASATTSSTVYTISCSVVAQAIGMESTLSTVYITTSSGFIKTLPTEVNSVHSTGPSLSAAMTTLSTVYVSSPVAFDDAPIISDPTSTISNTTSTKTSETAPMPVRTPMPTEWEVLGTRGAWIATIVGFFLDFIVLLVSQCSSYPIVALEWLALWNRQRKRSRILAEYLNAKLGRSEGTDYEQMVNHEALKQAIDLLMALSMHGRHHNETELIAAINTLIPPEYRTPNNAPPRPGQWDYLCVDMTRGGPHYTTHINVTRDYFVFPFTNIQTTAGATHGALGDNPPHPADVKKENLPRQAQENRELGANNLLRIPSHQGNGRNIEHDRKDKKPIKTQQVLVSGPSRTMFGFGLDGSDEGPRGRPGHPGPPDPPVSPVPPGPLPHGSIRLEDGSIGQIRPDGTVVIPNPLPGSNHRPRAPNSPEALARNPGYLAYRAGRTPVSNLPASAHGRVDLSNGVVHRGDGTIIRMMHRPTHLANIMTNGSRSLPNGNHASTNGTSGLTNGTATSTNGLRALMNNRYAPTNGNMALTNGNHATPPSIGNNLNDHEMTDADDADDSDDTPTDADVDDAASTVSQMTEEQLIEYQNYRLTRVTLRHSYEYTTERQFHQPNVPVDQSATHQEIEDEVTRRENSGGYDELEHGDGESDDEDYETKTEAEPEAEPEAGEPRPRMRGGAGHANRRGYFGWLFGGRRADRVVPAIPAAAVPAPVEPAVQEPHALINAQINERKLARALLESTMDETDSSATKLSLDNAGKLARFPLSLSSDASAVTSADFVKSFGALKTASPATLRSLFDEHPEFAPLVVMQHPAAMIYLPVTSEAFACCKRFARRAVAAKGEDLGSAELAGALVYFDEVTGEDFAAVFDRYPVLAPFVLAEFGEEKGEFMRGGSAAEAFARLYQKVELRRGLGEL